MPIRPKKTTLRALRKRAGKAGFGRAPHNEVLGPLRTVAGRKNPNFRCDWIVSDALSINRNPAVIVDHVSDYLLAAHMEAILHGMKADGSGPQAKLRKGTQKRRALAGKRLDARGINTGGFARNLMRNKIRVSGGKLANGDDGTVARCRIFPGASNARRQGDFGGLDASGNEGDYPAFIANESHAGITYFFTTGEIERGISECLQQWLDLAIFDHVRDPDFSSYRAPDAKAS